MKLRIGRLADSVNKRMGEEDSTRRHEVKFVLPEFQKLRVLRVFVLNPPLAFFPVRSRDFEDVLVPDRQSDLVGDRLDERDVFFAELTRVV